MSMENKKTARAVIDAMSAARAKDKMCKSLATCLEGIDESEPGKGGFGAEHLAAMRVVNASDVMLVALRRIAGGQWPKSIAETEGTLAMREVARNAIAQAEGRDNRTTCSACGRPGHGADDDTCPKLK